MKNKTIAAVSILLGSSSLALGCAVHGSASVNVPPPPTLVVEGQVGVQGQAQTEVVVQGEPPAPPPPQAEPQPPSPGVEYVWIGGYHRWNGRSYVWVNGRYEHRPHANATWRAAHWEPRGTTHVWIEGNWEGQGTVAVAPPPPVVAPPPSPVPQGGVEIVVQGAPPAPPPPQAEPVPPSPGVEYVWIGGYHRWNGHAYGWVGGHYEHRPHAGAEWKVAHWEPRGNAHVWVEGSWDAKASASASSPGPTPIGSSPAAAHPEYLHALADLRNARAHLERQGGDRQVKWDEHDAIGAIDRAIHDIKEAALDDGKSLADHPPVDAREVRGGRLHKALDALHAARADVNKEEDNGFARGLRGRAAHDIEEAIHATELGIEATMK